MAGECSVDGAVAEAEFALRIHRGEGMVLVAMNWKGGPPPADFVGFALQYAEPGSSHYFDVKNRLTFDGNAGTTPSAGRPPNYSTMVAPIQKFRWVHFPRNADLPGDYSYRVTPVFMNPDGSLRYGTAQQAALALARETYPGELNIAFTRGFVSSQAFVDYYGQSGPLDTLLPMNADDGMTFKATHPKAEEAYGWMGFEARAAMMKLLDDAIADAGAQVGVVAFDFNLPEAVDRIKQLAGRVRVIIDNSDDHEGGAEDEAAKALEDAGIPVVRQAMGKLQHNKTIWVDGPTVQRVLCGSTNMSWRGLFVQSNNVMVVDGAAAVKVFKDAFEAYWSAPAGFPGTPAAGWQDLGLGDIDAKITFSPHGKSNSVLAGIGADVASARSSLFYSLAFLAITPGVIRDAIAERSGHDSVFVAGISDARAGVKVAVGSSNLPPTYVAVLDKNVPFPFRAEPTGLAGNVGTRMHHKFIVIDFDTPDARVYLGSYNMSKAADGSNGDNVALVRDRRVATSYMIEAVRMVDHYQFRAALKERKASGAGKLTLKRPPAAGEEAWWARDWSDPRAIKDRELFA
ncbi:phospholipase D-like domain-containing protein [Sphingomonas sp.]|uniref:phospholipase D-like domain-containing protein n=1 Tax=Sphingomonas sp. TaxID=28214 RepID=UPI001B1CB05D|nr:phospholipase D-like domain-containing protein [Sphingomonas sp.]MBO9713696.1 hypothetical protein [Sphingomonas sp.]